jgi:hypothetical protein
MDQTGGGKQQLPARSRTTLLIAEGDSHHAKR